MRRGSALPELEVLRLELAEARAQRAALVIENARLSTELRARSAELQESLEQQTAISDILGVISRSPTDIRPVLDSHRREVAVLFRDLHDARSTWSAPVRAATDGPEAYKAFLRRHAQTFPEDQMDVEALVAEGDDVACRWRFQRRHGHDEREEKSCACA